jgi:hypothetical protein
MQVIIPIKDQNQGVPDDVINPSQKSQDKETDSSKKQKKGLFSSSSSSGSTVSSDSSSEQVSHNDVRVQSQGIFRGKELLFQQHLIHKQHQKLLPTAKNKAG